LLHTLLRDGPFFEDVAETGNRIRIRICKAIRCSSL